MKKKVMITALTGLSLLVLGGCSKGGNETIASMKGNKITVSDFYEQAKSNQNSQQLMQQMIILQAFDDKYGDKVSKKDVDAAYDKMAKQLGDQFETQLKQAGMTKDSYKKSIQQQKAMEYGMKDHVKLTDSDLKAAWESYHPEVSAQMILVQTEDEAKAVKEEASKPDADFSKIAKDKSKDTSTKDKGGEVKFDSTSTTVPAEVQAAAFKLTDGQVSDPITVASQYGQSFYVVKMVKNTPKGNDMDKYKKEVKKVAEDKQLSDQSFQTKTIGQVLKDQNVTIEDKSVSSILESFLGDSGKSSKSDKKSDSKSTDKDSSTKK